jgi:hypothetical protein
VIPSAAAPHSWNLIFESGAAGGYKLLASEPFARHATESAISSENTLERTPSDRAGEANGASNRERSRAGTERRLASWGGAARQAGRWEGEGGPQRRGGDSQTALARAGCGRPLGVPSLEQPRRIHAPLKVKERHPSERQVCEIRPGLYPLRARQNAGEKNGRTNADLAEANQEATARQLGEMAAAWL